MNQRLTRMLPLLLTGAAITLVPAAAAARPVQEYSFDLPSGDLGGALRSVAARAGWEIYAPADEVNGKQAPALKGVLSPRAAIERLLAGSGLEASFSDGAVVIRGRAQAAAGSAEPEIVVTGSHIRGAQVAGEVITVPRRSIAAAGQTDLGEAMRAIPQNFGGGQNPGIGFGAGAINSNVNSAASVNLRGLGPDATLTLLNGRRLPYDAAGGGVDISAIPLAAVDRIEVVPDGASALYGSDAVAGVVNVLLRRDFDGIATSAQLGAASDGGDFRQQADLVAGKRWNGGGFILAYDFAHNSAIAARGRDYASALRPAASLYPQIRRHAVTLSGHQDLGHGVTFSIDALYSKRWSTIVAGTEDQQYLFRPVVESWSIAPELDIAVGGDWTVKALASLGRDRTQYDTAFTPVGSATTVTSGCICNRAANAEVDAEGPLFQLAGGAARLALGAGYRSNGLLYSRLTDGVTGDRFDYNRHSSYAFGELYLPFIGPEKAIKGVNRLSLSAALRYEDYPGMAHLATPRLGLIYAPTAALTLRGSWARSFKAPTLYQQYSSYQAYLLPAAAVGAGGAGQTIIYAGGGNPELKPERALSWTAGFDWRPPSLPGLSLSATWFDVRYTDRVVEPIPGSITSAFQDPGYASLLVFNPSAGQLANLIAGAELGLQNFSGGAYDPAGVVALVDNRNTNVAAQAIHGIDAHAAWRLDLADKRSLTFDLAGTWLESSQQVTTALPVTTLAGTVFNPPHVKIRAGVTYAAERLLTAAFVNYTGGFADRRFAAPSRIAPTATLDLSARYDLVPGGKDEAGLALTLTINNVFNARPPLIRTTGPTDTPYDSTNFSPIGRFIALGLARRW